nr:peptidoglycan-binding protein [Candidatus Paceibacterota bacterium]
MEQKSPLKKILIWILIIILLILGILYFIFRPKLSDIGNVPIRDILTPGRGGTQVTPGNEVPGNTLPDGTVVPNPFSSITNGERFRQLTNFPVSGYNAFVGSRTEEELVTDPVSGIISTITKTVPIEVLRYIERSTGYIWDAEITEVAVKQRTASKTSVPKIAEGLVLPNGNTIVMRNTSGGGTTIETFLGTFPSKNTVFSYCGDPITAEIGKGTTNKPQAKALQTYLKSTVAPTMTIDGSFGNGTERSLKEFQKRAGLPETGKTDEGTRTAIETDCNEKRIAFEAEKNEPVELTGGFLGEDIQNITFAPDGSQLFYTQNESSGVAGYTIYPDGSRARKAFSSPFTEWLPEWINKDAVSLVTYPSRDADGFLYVLNPNTGAFVKRFGPKKGLTAKMSPDGTWIITSESTQTGLLSKLVNLKTGESKDIEPPTLPEKCVWQKNSLSVVCAVPTQTPRAMYPDEWYQGLVTFQDEFWNIEVSPFRTTKLYTPKDSYDFIRPILGPDGEFLYITDKDTGYLWSLRVNE